MTRYFGTFWHVSVPLCNISRPLMRLVSRYSLLQPNIVSRLESMVYKCGCPSQECSLSHDRFSTPKSLTVLQKIYNMAIIFLMDRFSSSF